MRIWVCCLLALGMAGCDRDDPVAPAIKRTPVLGVEIQSLTPLPANRVTHIAPTPTGAIFWVQEAEAGTEIVFAMNEGSVPVATTLTSAAIAQTMGESSAAGTIQSLAAGTDGKIYFYYTGGKGKRLLAAVGAYTPENGRTGIIADTSALMSQSEMGDSLALARGSLLIAGNTLWIWLRHDDGYAVLSIDMKHTDAKFARAFASVRADGEEVPMTSSLEDLATGTENALLYLDRRTGKIWKIGPHGDATAAADITTLPTGMTAPSLDEKGKMVLFVPEETPPNEFEILPATRPTKFPGLVILSGNQPIELGRSAFTAPPKFNIRAMTLSQLVRDRNSWLAYEKQTGELLRLRVVER